MATTTHFPLVDIATMNHDGNEVCRASFDRITRSYLRQIVSDAVIEEHRRSPSGRHGEALGRVLAYFRRLPPERQYLLRQVAGGYRIVRMATQRNGVGNFVGDETFPTPNAGYHGIFMLKLKDMLEEDNG